MGKNAVILHSIENAIHTIKNKYYVGNCLFSTYSGVNVYLKERYGIESRCLSEIFGYEEIIQIKNEASECVDRLLKLLDSEISPYLNKQLKLDMRYFLPLYGYIGKFHFSSYLFFVKAVERLINKYGFKKLFIYNYCFNYFIDGKTDINYVISAFFHNFDIEVINRINNTKDNSLQDLFFKLRMMMSPQIAKRVFKQKYEEIFIHLKNSKLSHRTVKKYLIFNRIPRDPYFRKIIHNYNILFLNKNFRNNRKYIHNNDFLDIKDKIGIKIIALNQDRHNFFERIFLKDIKEGFLKNMENYLVSLSQIREFYEKHPVLLGFWDLPPIEGELALVYEYLMANQINIIGMQHGCCYGDSFYPWHFDSDFNRCDYFISYGFDVNDLRRLYPSFQINTQIIPRRSFNQNNIKPPRRKIDILFPLTNSSSILEDGMTRLPPHELTNRQLKIMEFLNSLKKYKSYIKLFTNANLQNCSVLSAKKRLKRLRYVSNMSLIEFIETFYPKAVIIEFPSQPLFDVIGLDTEIFLMNDPLHPYETEALKLLKRRVYYSEDIDELISWVNLFIKGMLPSKRDNSFYYHYVYNDKREDNISKLIEGMSKRVPKDYLNK